jgi:uncharacterized protein YndB with AHSA1/START domain
MSDTVRLQRDYPASCERVFAAWTKVELLTQWFGCGPDMLWTVQAWDARVGGGIHVSLTFESGPYEVRGEFLAIEPPHHIRYRFGDQIVDATMEARGTGCRLTVEHSGLATGDLRRVVTGGWTNGLAQLDAVAVRG